MNPTTYLLSSQKTGEVVDRYHLSDLRRFHASDGEYRSFLNESNEEIRYILKFYYKKGENATQAAKKICDVYGFNAVSVRVAQIWFKRFQSGNFDIKNARRSGRPVTDKIDAIFEKVAQDRHISSYRLYIITLRPLGAEHQ
ncbi:hypothetical protein K1T71_009515 [Dendrolimus kikuchii]|uniref:Uncharacterized protein n=1 Tax=Dendrolimus kikuchii TaxID=765133 RepID=A0ACC1CS28_9NEOP|nr:hypothetical protein K1T71_009515 [Dendrolimus kikuchii]